MSTVKTTKIPHPLKEDQKLLVSSPEKLGDVSKLTGGAGGSDATVASKSNKKDGIVKKEQKGGDVSASAVGERIKVGGTVYQRIFCHDESGAFGGDQISVWTQEGKSKEEGWVEVTLGTGDIAYIQWRNPHDTRWHLPDVSSTHFPVTVEEKTFKHKREWAEPERKVVWSAAEKALDECSLSRGGDAVTTEEERGKMVRNIANGYMATRGLKGSDEGLERWMRRAAAAEFDTLLLGRAMDRAMLQQVSALELQQKIGIVETVSRELVKRNVLPTLESQKQLQGDDDDFSLPASPFLPRTRFIRNPYYVTLLENPSSCRSCIESRLEATTFAASGTGEVRVLSAVAVCEGCRGPQERLFAVARDWTGAFCFCVLEPFTDASEATLLAIYPLLGEVDMLPTSHQKVYFRIDGMEFVASFRNIEDLQWFHDTLKAALTSMYGDGNDSERIVKMRAYSVNFAAHYTSKPPLDVFKVMHNVLSRSDHADVLMKDDIFHLRACLGKSQGRDTVSRLWLKSVEDSCVKYGVSHSVDFMNNHLEVMEELIRCPTQYTDSSIPSQLQGRLEEMGKRFPEFMARCSRIGVLLDYTDCTMQTWKPRCEIPDVPWESCFKPVGHSQAAEYESSLLMERRLRGTACQRPPGIYLSVLCFCGSRVFTDEGGNLISEVIVQDPTQTELQQLTPDCEDYQWLLRLGGTDKNWVDNKLPSWIKVYEKCATETFKARFVQAASRLWQTRVFPTLGCIFDTPIIQRGVGSALVLTICELESEEFVSSNAGVWCDAHKLESFTYTDFLMCRDGARVAFLPGNYRHCVRYVDAAMQYQRSFTHCLSPGFYLGFFIFSVSKEGTLMLVPECNRNLPPLVKVSGELPSLLHWRWLQSLNYRHQTTGTFGLPMSIDLSLPPDENAPFESKVGYALATLEAAVGLRVQKFYDLDLFTLDETQTIYAFFAVAYYPPPLHGLSDCDIPEAPKGLVPMTFKLVRVVDNHHQQRYWSTVYGCLDNEADFVYRRLCTTTQPFTSDEALRLHPPGEAIVYAIDMDRYALLWSWARALAIWGESDGQTLVEKHAGKLLKVVAMGESEYHSTSSLTIEEVVDVAVTNQAAATDPNLFELKSLLLQLFSVEKHEWSSVLRRIQEKDDTIRRGYAGRVALMPSKDSETSVPLRSYDDLPLDDHLYSSPRSVTVYELPCTLMEFISGENDLSEAYLFASDIIDEIIEMTVMGGSVAVLGQVAETMVSCVETAEDMVDGVPLEVVRAEAEEMVWSERQAFMKKWTTIFNTSHRISTFNDELKAPLEMQAEVFHAGSKHYIGCAADGLRVCLARAASDGNRMQELLCMANSALHSLELAESLRAYKRVLEGKERIFLDLQTDKHKKQQRVDEKFSGLETTAKRSPLVILVSREQHEVSLYSLDPLRCLALQGDRMRVPLPDFSYVDLSEFGSHMNAPEQDVALQLRDFNPSVEAQKRMLDMAFELQAPLLLIRLLVLLYCPSTACFGEEAANVVRAHVTVTAGGFLFQYGVRDWFQMEVLGGHAVLAGFDVLWWLRYLEEASEGKREPYSSYSGSWKQVYAETRVRLLLPLGVGHISEEEVALWSEGLGRLVAYISFRDMVEITDAEVSLLAASCPFLRSLDLSGTVVTDQSAQLLGAKCKRLVECSVMGTRVSRQATEELDNVCRRNALIQ